MTTLKTLTIAAALLAGTASLAFAQNGPGTGGNAPAAGGAGNAAMTSGPNGAGAGDTGNGMMNKSTTMHKKHEKKM